jgi:hypothetical protein
MRLYFFSKMTSFPSLNCLDELERSTDCRVYLIEESDILQKSIVLFAGMDEKN